MKTGEQNLRRCSENPKQKGNKVKEVREPGLPDGNPPTLAPMVRVAPAEPDLAVAGKPAAARDLPPERRLFGNQVKVSGSRYWPVATSDALQTPKRSPACPANFCLSRRAGPATFPSCLRPAERNSE